MIVNDLGIDKSGWTQGTPFDDDGDAGKDKLFEPTIFF
jgi:hypothetical protein